MAMRITTKMMQSRSLNNLNSNKVLQEKLTTQLSTGKKITRPSDDPVVAIRALKLNSSLNKIDQYYEKNCNDAESWMTLTESAIKTTSQIITDMRTYIVQAAQGSLEASDRADILENLSNFRTEIYATGNADSDGRSIFTGYRTNMPLTVQADKTEKYQITEQLTNASLGTTTYVKTGDLSTINEGNFDSKTTTEYDVTSYDVARIRLAYDNLDYDATKTPPSTMNVSFLVDTSLTQDTAGNNGVTVDTTSYTAFVQQDMAAGNMQITVKDKNDSTLTYAVTIDGAGTVASTPPLPADIAISADMANGQLIIEESSALLGNVYKTTTLGMTAANNQFTFDKQYETTLQVTDYVEENIDKNYNGVYEKVYGEANADNIVYVAETGELLLGTNIQSQLAGLSATAEIRVTYDKTDWKEGDLDPVHYYYTKKYDDADPSLTNYVASNKYTEYNAAMLTDPEGTLANQKISYDIGNNQTIQVNTTADQLFTHDIGRDIDEVITMLNEFVTLDETYAKVESMIKSGKYEGDELEKLELQLAGLGEARTKAKAKVQDTCEGLISTFDGYIKQTTEAYTDIGSRASRLKLIQNRLSAQQTNFEELVSENEDADITDLAIQLSSVELTYEAALSSISYIMQTTLLNFI